MNWTRSMIKCIENLRITQQNRNKKSKNAKVRQIVASWRKNPTIQPTNQANEQNHQPLVPALMAGERNLLKWSKRRSPFWTWALRLSFIVSALNDTLPSIDLVAFYVRKAKGKRTKTSEQYRRGEEDKKNPLRKANKNRRIVHSCRFCIHASGRTVFCLTPLLAQHTTG